MNVLSILMDVADIKSILFFAQLTAFKWLVDAFIFLPNKHESPLETLKKEERKEFHLSIIKKL